MTRNRLELLQWFSLFAGPLAWATEHIVGYFISDAACSVAGARWGFDAAAWQAVLAVLAGVVVIAAWFAAFVTFRETSAVDKDEPGPLGRIHFFAQAALLGNVLFFVIVVLDGVGSIHDLPCSQS
ncbi:MAG: hypothetical protein QOH16_2747 [Gaiellaceae bacterium]|jgi:uncharacterized membrane protein|nr:hypothetical protein [Gaiellaceae bacterium]